MDKYLPSWLRWSESCNETGSEASSFVSLSHTSEQEDAEVQRLVTHILRLHTKLSFLSALKPCEEVNALFEELVGLCTQTGSESVTVKVMSDSKVIEILPSLQHICAKAESHLESHWAEIIAGPESESKDADEVYDRLVKFPYFNNYVDLTRLELGAIYTVDTSPIKKIAFIGSGPLPLSSLQLIHTLSSDIEILNIDHNLTAVCQSSRLCESLGSKGKGMKFLCSEAGSYDLREFDVVYLAALVGSTQEEKEVLLMDIVAKMRKGATLVVRSAHGLRTVLYPEFDPMTEAVKGCLDVQLVVHPYNHVVNSVIVGRVRIRGKEHERS